MLESFYTDSLSERSLADLMSWHAREKKRYDEDLNLHYSPKDELVKYCRQDVRILREGFEVFRKALLKHHPHLEPLHYVTFPSYNNAVFRTYFMVPQSIAVLPPLGYNAAHASIISLAWLDIMRRQFRLKDLRTARKGYEVQVGNYFIDGFGVDAQGWQHMFQFNGCYWHGHTCLTKRPGMADYRYAATCEMLDTLQRLSVNRQSPFKRFKFHHIWECEFRDLYIKNSDIKVSVDRYIQHYPAEQLQLRDAMRGGRTNVIKHSVTSVRPGWSIRYLDFTSLVPPIS